MASESIFLQEGAIERYLRAQVTKRGGRSFKFESPSQRGVPDRIVVAPGGQVWFVEVKAPKGELSALQKIMIEALEDYGANVAVVYSKEDVNALLNKIFS